MADSDSLKVPFSRPSISKEEETAVLDVLRSGWLTTGKQALAFEKEFSYYMNKVDDSVIAARKAAGLSAKDVISLAVNSATSGMVLAMEACGVKPGTAVITTPYTFVSTAACAKHLGADVLFADIESGSYSIDAGKVEKLLAADDKKKIVAVVPVHIAGNVCDMERLVKLAHKYNVKVIEDAAHAFPSLTKLGYAGTICDAGVFFVLRHKDDNNRGRRNGMRPRPRAGQAHDGYENARNGQNHLGQVHKPASQLGIRHRGFGLEIQFAGPAGRNRPGSIGARERIL